MAFFRYSKIVIQNSEIIKRKTLTTEISSPIGET